MPARRSPRKLPAHTEKAPDVIEIPSSDSESEAPEIEDEAPEPTEPTLNSGDANEQPLLRAAGIKYNTDLPEEEEPQQDQQLSPSSAKLAVRTRDTGSAKHRHVNIEIPLPTSSELRRRAAGASASGSQDANDEEVLQTTDERKHITFDDSDYDEFVTPREGPSRDPLESSISQSAGKDEEEEEEEAEEDSDDEAPPEAFSTRAAEAETLKAVGAAAKAAEQHASALKRKRQERDAFLKRQAEERKRTQKLARQEDEDDDVTPDTQQPSSVTEKRKRDVPKLLPLELLESDDEGDVPQQPNSIADGKHKRRKLGGTEQALLREPKLPKDKRLGSTAYRVVKDTGDARLAPKAKKQAIDLRETLLRRNRAPQPRGGFFVKNR